MRCATVFISARKGRIYRNGVCKTDGWRQRILAAKALGAHSEAGAPPHARRPRSVLVAFNSTTTGTLAVGTALGNHTVRQSGSAASTLASTTPQQIIGDTVLWDSRTSYLHQMVDVIACFTKQLFEPNGRVREKGTHNYFHRLAPIKLLKQQHTNIRMV